MPSHCVQRKCRYLMGLVSLRAVGTQSLFGVRRGKFLPTQPTTMPAYSLDRGKLLPLKCREPIRLRRRKTTGQAPMTTKPTDFVVLDARRSWRKPSLEMNLLPGRYSSPKLCAD